MSDPLLRVEDVSVRFTQRRWLRRSEVVAVTGVTLQVHRGETLAIVGESGSGKTTLARSILGLQQLAAGRIVLDGADTDHLSRADRRKMSAIFQDPTSSLDPRMPIWDTITEPLLPLSSAERRLKAADLLSAVGLEPSFGTRRPASLSGGQRQRVAIARALATDPLLIVCDEAVSALDVSTQALVINLLHDLQRETGVALVFIAHDLAVVAHIATRTAVMYHGRIIEIGPARQVFREPMHPYTKALHDAVPQLRAPRRRSSYPVADQGQSIGCPYADRCPRADDRCWAERPALVELAPKREVACHLPLVTTMGAARSPMPDNL